MPVTGRAVKRVAERAAAKETFSIPLRVFANSLD
jgi:hypothetical protein